MNPDENFEAGLIPTKEELNAQIDLESMVKETSAAYVTQRKNELAGVLQKQFQKMNSLIADVKKAEVELNKKKNSLNQIQALITKVRAGDWSVVTQMEKEAKNQGGKQQQEEKEEDQTV